jgi:hypothetical protein
MTTLELVGCGIAWTLAGAGVCLLCGWWTAPALVLLPVGYLVCSALTCGEE